MFESHSTVTNLISQTQRESLKQFCELFICILFVLSHVDMVAVRAVFSELSESSAGDVFFRTSSAHHFL